MAEPEKNKEAAQNLKELYDKKFADLNVSEKKDPVLFQLKTLLSTEEGRQKVDDIAKLSFDYLMDNKSMAYSKTKRGIFDSILNALGIVDKGLASYVEETVNQDPVMASRTKDKSASGVKPVNVLVLYDETKTRGHEPSEKAAAGSNSGEDPRIENLKELLKRFKSKEVSPWHHINSEKYDNMIKSIEHAVEYSNAMEKGYGSKAVLDKMLEDVRNNTLNYLEKKSDTPDDKYGQARINLAIASLLSVDRQKGLEAIDMVATKRMMRLEGRDRDAYLAKIGEDPSKTRFSKSTFMSLDKIIKETGYKDDITREDMTKAINDRMELGKQEMYDPQYGMDEVGLATYVMLQAMSEMIKNMTGNDWIKFDVSQDEFDKQRSNVMASDPFISVHAKIFDVEPLKEIKPNEFYMSFKVTIVEIHKVEMAHPAAAQKARETEEAQKARVNTGAQNAKAGYEEQNARVNEETNRRNHRIPAQKTTKELYDEIKEYLHLDKDATFNVVNKALTKEIIKNHPDKLGDARDGRTEEINRLEKVAQQLGEYKNALKQNEEEFRKLDAIPQKEPIKASVPTNTEPAGPSMRR